MVSNTAALVEGSERSLTLDMANKLPDTGGCIADATEIEIGDELKLPEG